MHLYCSAQSLEYGYAIWMLGSMWSQEPQFNKIQEVMLELRHEVLQQEGMRWAENSLLGRKANMFKGPAVTGRKPLTEPKEGLVHLSPAPSPSLGMWQTRVNIYLVVTDGFWAVVWHLPEPSVGYGASH